MLSEACIPLFAKVCKTEAAKLQERPSENGTSRPVENTAHTGPQSLFRYASYKVPRRAFLAALSGSHAAFGTRPTPPYPKTPLLAHLFGVFARRFTRHATRDNLVRDTRKWFRELLHAIRNTRLCYTQHATRSPCHATRLTRHWQRGTRPTTRALRKLTRDTLHAIRDNKKTKTQHATRDLRHAREQTCKTMI